MNLPFLSQDNFSPNKFVKASVLFGFSFIIIIFVALFYYMNKGFEQSDETYFLYFSNIIYPHHYNTGNFGVLNHFACFGKPTLLNLRLAKFFYQTLAALFFIWSLFKYLNFKRIVLNTFQKTLIFIIILITSFAQYDYIPMTLSYNSWAQILMLICLGIIFIEFTITKKSICIITSLLYGFICFSLFLTKFPNAVFAMCFYGMFNLFYIRKGVIIKMCFFFVGAFLGYCIILKTPENLLALIENYRITLFDIKHAEGGLYFKQIYKSCLTLWKYKYYSAIGISLLIAASIVTWHILKKIKNSTTEHKSKNAFIFLIVLLTACFPFCKGNGHISFNDFIGMGVIMLNPFLFVYIFKTQSFNFKVFIKNELNILIIILIVTPVLLMLGTNNAFWYSTSPTMVFTFTGVLVYLVNSKTNYTNYLSLLSIIVCLFMLSILYHGAIKKPYRQENLNHKNALITQSPLLKGIYESNDAYIDYQAVNTILNKLNINHKPFINFYNFFGFNIINETETATDIVLSSQERMLEFNDYMLSKIDVKTTKPLILLPDTVLNQPKFIPLFNKHHIYLNKNYKLIYTYKLLSQKETMFFYIPNF